MPQSDTYALSQGSNLVFENNYCSGGHGISIGSISGSKTVSGVTISGNTVVASMYGMRIKVDRYALQSSIQSIFADRLSVSDATGSVSDVTYSGNSIAANDKYGFLVSQSYSEDFGTPGTESTIAYVLFRWAVSARANDYFQ